MLVRHAADESSLARDGADLSTWRLIFAVRSTSSRKGMFMSCKSLLSLVAALMCPATWAAYDANMVGEIEGFYVYSDTDQVYFRLKNQPTSHNGCNHQYFVIPTSVSADRRKAMLARLSLAYAMREPVNIGYAANGDCGHGYINVYRVG